jgi:hypothetical protein
MGFPKKSIFVLIVALYIFLFSTNINSQTFEDALRPFWYFKSFSSASSALCNSNLATYHGILTTLSNPANLGLANHSSALLSLQYGILNQNSKLENNNYYISDNDKYFRFDGFGLIYPVPVYQGNFTLALSYAPSAQYNYILKTEGWDEYEGDSLYLSHNITETGILNTLSFGASVEFQKNVFIGFGLNVHNGFRDYSYAGVDIDTMDTFTYSKYTRNEYIKPNYEGWNLNFGILYQSSPLKLGFRFSTPLNLEVHEKSRIESVEIFDNKSKETESIPFDLKYKTKFPMEIAGGIAFTFLKVTLSLEFTNRDWGNINFKSPNIYTDTTNTTLLSSIINEDIRLHLKSTTDWNISLTAPIQENILIYLGYRNIPRPYYDLKDNEKNVSVMGIGSDITIENKVVIGLSYQISMGRQSIYNNYFKTSTTQKFQEHHFTLSTSILF